MREGPSGAAGTARGEAGSNQGRDAAAGASGEGAAADGAGGGSGSSAAVPPDAAPTVDDELQVWLGELRTEHSTVCRAEPDYLEPRSERMLLLLELDQAGAVVAASITVGEGQPPPPAEDPYEFYPPNPSWWPDCPLALPVAGFEYPAYHARLQQARFELTFFPSDVFASWCALQESYPASDEAKREFGQDYLCRPTEGVELNTVVSSTSVDGLCLRPLVRACRCNAERCVPEHHYPHVLDLAVDGDQMQGRLITSAYGTAEVRLRRHR